MNCPWRKETYIPLRERYKEGQEFDVRGQRVTLIEVDYEDMLCLVRPHSNPVDLVVIPLDDLE